MSTETRLRDEIQAAATQLGDDPGELARVIQRGNRRRYRRQGTVAGVATIGVVAVAGVVGPWSPPAGLPLAGQLVEAEPDMVIWFCDDVAVQAEDDTACRAVASADDVARVRGALNLDAEVLGVRLETPEQAYERFAELFADQPDLVASVDPDTLASSLRITLADDADPGDIERRYLAFDGVAQVATLDTD